MKIQNIENFLGKFFLKTSYNTLFILILLLGLALRLIFMFINKSDLFTDAAFSIYYAKFPLEELSRIIIYDPTPPLYYLLLHFLLKISDSLLFIKLAHIILGILSIIVMYFLGKSLYDKKTGLAAALFTSISLTHIYYSNEIRHYILWITFIGLNLLFFQKALKNNKSYEWFLFITTAVLAFYTNYLTILYVLTIFFLFFIFAQKIKKSADKAFASLKISLLLIFFLGAPLLLIKLGTMLFSANSSGHQQLIGGFQPSVVYFYLVFEGFLFNNAIEILQSIPLEIIILAVVLILFFNSLLEIKKIDKNDLVLEIRTDNSIKILFLAFLIIFLVFSFLGLYLIRYLFLLFPLFVIILSRGYANIKSLFLKTGIGSLVVILALITLPALARNTNNQISEAAGQIKLQEENKDLILILPPEHFWNFNYYYKGSLPVYDLFINYPDRSNKNNSLEIIRIKSGGTTNEFNFVTKDNIDNLNNITANYNRVWLILAADYSKKDPDSLVEKYFIKNWQLISQDKKINLYLYKK